MIKALIAALREARAIRQYVESAEQSGFWTKEDSMILLRFMVGNTGQKLRVRLGNMVYRGMLEATNTPNGKEYTGDFQEDKRHGNGKFRWKDGREYEGQWVKGK